MAFLPTNFFGVWVYEVVQGCAMVKVEAVIDVALLSNTVDGDPKEKPKKRFQDIERTMKRCVVS